MHDFLLTKSNTHAQAYKRARNAEHIVDTAVNANSVYFKD